MKNALTTLTAVKSWLSITNSTDDAMLTRLINTFSRGVLAYLNRPYIFRYDFTRRLNGQDSQVISLTDFPVIEINSLKVGTVTIPPASSPDGAGYTLAPWDGFTPGGAQQLSLNGYCYARGFSNVEVQYTAGYAITDEPQTIPEPVPAGDPPVTPTTVTVTVDQPQGAWGQDDGVSSASGTPFTLVTGTPASGQYALGTTAGEYIFSADDADEQIVISYSYVPYDLEQCVIEMIAERYRYRDRIGMNSKTLAGQETISFSNKDLTDSVRTALAPYRRVVL